LLVGASARRTNETLDLGGLGKDLASCTYIHAALVRVGII